jgi:hypothetical protein
MTNDVMTPVADHVRPAVVAWTIGAGVLLGGTYALSPLTVWFVAATIGLFAWAGHGLSERERRWVFSLLALAIALRLLAVALLFLSSDHQDAVSFFWDGDGVALKRRGLWVRNVWLGVPITPLAFFVAFDPAYGWTTYIYVLAYLQYLVGPAPYAVHLFNIALFLAMAVALYRLARSAYGPEASLLGFGLLLFLPTPFFWSVSALKESLYLLLAVLALVGAVTALRPRPLLVRALALIVLVGALAAIGGVRTGGRLITMAGLAAGFAGSVVVRRVSLVLLVLILMPFAVSRLWNNAAVQARVMSQLKTSAVAHMGNVRTEGHGYKVLDRRFYFFSNDMLETMTPAEGLRFTLRAVASVILVPLPWQIQSTSEMVFLPQQVVWYLLVPFAIVGLVAGLRRDALVTCMLAGLAAAGAVVVALNSGNVGTMVRHRDTVVPFVVWLSALGAVATVSNWVSRTSR